MFLEEVIKVRGFSKTQRVSNVRYVPATVLKQNIGFLYQALGDDLGGGFLGSFFHCSVEVIDVDIELIGKIGSRT